MSQTRRSANFTRRNVRRGSLYVSVLGVSIVVSLVGFAAIHLVRLTLTEIESRNDRYEASLLAESAIENALITIENDSSWRTNYTSDVEYPVTPVTLGSGTFTWKLYDRDGSLTNDVTDDVLLQGIGRVGGVTHVEQVRLHPTETGLTCLETSLHCDNTISSGSSVDIVTNQIVSSNGSISASGIGSQISGDAEGVGAVTGNITGTATAGVPSRQMPQDSVFDYYIRMGTRIDRASLLSGSQLILEKIVLSPSRNPYGSTNPEGIYVIDCEGSTIRIRDLRVNGTLVILNPSGGARIENEVHIAPHAANFPSLIVLGSMQFRFNSGSNLSEASEGVNFNPIGTPYLSAEDSDTNDTYPCVIQGIVCVSGNANFVNDGQSSSFEGVFVCETISANSDIDLTYDSIHINYPPPGFASGHQMEIIPGSWQRSTSP